jgi:hypothetical protein
VSTCQSNLSSSLTVSLREMRIVFERLTQVTRVEPGLVPALRDCAIYSAALGLGGFARLKANLEAVKASDPHAVTLADAKKPVVNGGGQHAWIVAEAVLELAIETLRIDGNGVVTVRNVSEISELKIVEALAQRFGAKASVTIAAQSAVITVSPATEAYEIAILDTIRRNGLVVDAALWWDLYHSSAEALAPDSYLSRRHAGPIIVEADGKVIGRQDEDETDFSLLLADAPKSAAVAKH